MLAVDLCDDQAEAALSEPAAAGSWLRGHGLRGVLSAPGLQALLDLRASIDTLLRAAVKDKPPPATALERLNALSAEAAACMQLNWPAGGVPRMWVSTPGGPDAAAIGAVARSAIELLSGPDRQRLRICGAHGCERLFLASSSRQQWCSAACGNRVRVARHAARYRLR